ncbi:MAG: DUF3592 domain-containing protein [Opitutales bacterium]|nr:DUF3592 domain-containing protein [Opitutales bacterium]
MKIGGRIGAMKEFRDAYFSAGTRLKRFMIAIGEVLSTAFMLFFSILWTGISGGFLFSVLKNGTETGNVWGPALFLGIFVAAGIGLFSLGAYRLVSLILTVVKAPPSGSVPATSQPEILAGTGGTFSEENPFSSATEADSVPESSDELKETRGSKIFLALFGFVFFCAGITVSTLGVKKYRAEEQAAGTWISAPCKIISAKLESRRRSKGGTSYSPEIVYEFSVGGKTYRGNDIFMSMNSSSNDYDKEKERLQKYEKIRICWFNPENPEENALMRPASGFSLRKIVMIVFGMPFALIGGGLLVGTFFGKKFKKKEAQSALGALKSNGEDSLLGAIVVCGFALLWNLILFTVGAGFFADGHPGLFPMTIIGVFAAIGIGLIFVAAWCCLRSLNPRYEVVIFPAGRLRAGEFVRAEWRVQHGDPAKLVSLKAELVRLEKTNLYVNGKQKEKVAERVPVFATMSRTEIAAGTAEFCVPANIENGKWSLRLTGKTAFFRPGLKCDFRLP